MTAGPRECDLGEEVAAGGVAWERESLKNGTMEGDREERFERREQLASSQALRLHTNHIPQWCQYHTASDGRLGGRG